VFKDFEELDERIIARADLFSRLRYLKVKIPDRRTGEEIRTASKRPTPTNIAFAGGNVYMEEG
jgi:hypothetical protein